MIIIFDALLLNPQIKFPVKLFRYTVIAFPKFHNNMVSLLQGTALSVINGAYISDLALQTRHSNPSTTPHLILRQAFFIGSLNVILHISASTNIDCGF